MKKTLLLSITCFLFLAFNQLTLCQNIHNRKETIIEEQVALVFHEMIKTAENIDYDKLKKGVDDRYNAGFITNGLYFERYDSLHNLMKSRAGGVIRQNITVQKEKISVLSDNIVLLTAYGDAKIDLISGNSLSVKFFWSFVYEKIDDNWKVVYSHQSNDK